jgi:outer membrane protein OmpA-like peptidoglycan-associated protein
MKGKILFCLLLVSHITSGQGSNFKQVFMDAEYYMLTEHFSKALSYYENLLRIDPGNANLQYLCGYCYLNITGAEDDAISYLQSAVSNINTKYKEGSYKERQAPPEAYYSLARALQMKNEFERAQYYYEKYSSYIDSRQFADIEYVNQKIKSCELGRSMIIHPINVKFTSAGRQINNKSAAEYPVVSGNDSLMIFTLRKSTGRAVMSSTLDENGWSEPRMLNQELGLSGNFHPVCLSYEGTELYLVRSDYFDEDLYVSHYRPHRWSRIEKLNKNVNTKYFETHASLSRDGKTLIFTSDRKGGQGALDIYSSIRDQGDEWGPAVNLGPEINSFYNEETPFITRNDTRLYFSSLGHSTMGGYDIFYSDKNTGGSWSVPENIGYPISTARDDLFFNSGWDDQLAYYATVVDSISEIPGIYTVRIMPFETLDDSSRIKDDVRSGRKEYPTESLFVKQQEKNGSFSSLGIYYILNNILFNYDDYTLNEVAQREAERIYILMRKYPQINIELTGHTDAKGSIEYNMRLSDKRAKTVKNYLTGKGISPGRIVLKAAGETDPVAINKYEDGTDAPDGRKLNRYVSIKITNLRDENIRLADMFVPNELSPRQDQAYSILLLNSMSVIDTMPETIHNKPVSMIATDNGYLYTTGHFEHKTDAAKYLNEILDLGFPDAEMLEKDKLENMVRDRLEDDPYNTVKYTIQIMALKNPRRVSWFKNLENVKRFDGKDGFFRFVYGEFDNIETAVATLPDIRDKGYSDAFVMPMSKYNKISMNQ